MFWEEFKKSNSFVQENDYPITKKMRQTNFNQMNLSLLVGLLLFLSAPTKSIASSRFHGQTFGLVIDAGSTGSRLHVYRWPERAFDHVPPPATIPIEVNDFEPKKVEPGIDTEEGRKHLHWLLQNVTNDFKNTGISENRMRKFPLYLKATAGLRVLPVKSRQK